MDRRLWAAAIDNQARPRRVVLAYSARAVLKVVSGTASVAFSSDASAFVLSYEISFKSDFIIRSPRLDRP
jgi:hypothetical protein